MKEKEFHFSDVLISISATSAAEAYDKLTDALASINAEWETKTYRIDSEKKKRSTEELWGPRHETVIIDNKGCTAQVWDTATGMAGGWSQCQYAMSPAGFCKQHGGKG